MEAARLHGLGERERVARPVDVRGDLALLVRAEVVDGGQVEEVLDLAG
jgi:hypothetical protein